LIQEDDDSWKNLKPSSVVKPEHDSVIKGLTISVEKANDGWGGDKDFDLFS
jgi:hypothetical protein